MRPLIARQRSRVDVGVEEVSHAAVVLSLLSVGIQLGRQRPAQPWDSRLDLVFRPLGERVAGIGVPLVLVQSLRHALDAVRDKACHLACSEFFGRIKCFLPDGGLVGIAVCLRRVLQCGHHRDIQHRLHRAGKRIQRHAARRPLSALLHVPGDQRAGGQIRVDRIEESDGQQLVAVLPFRAAAVCPAPQGG